MTATSNACGVQPRVLCWISSHQDKGDRNARRDSPCLLGGLQFTGMPLLVLHIREDQVYAPTRMPDVRVAKDQDASPEAVQ